MRHTVDPHDNSLYKSVNRKELKFNNYIIFHNSFIPHCPKTYIPTRQGHNNLSAIELPFNIHPLYDFKMITKP